MFPKTLESVRFHEDGGAWAIGDALILECVPPARSNKPNKSGDKIIACARYLAEHGYNYSVVHLRRLRDVASIYRVDRRRSTLLWSIHAEIRDPNKLDELFPTISS